MPAAEERPHAASKAATHVLCKAFDVVKRRSGRDPGLKERLPDGAVLKTFQLKRELGRAERKARTWGKGRTSAGHAWILFHGDIPKCHPVIR